MQAGLDLAAFFLSVQPGTSEMPGRACGGWRAALRSRVGPLQRIHPLLLLKEWLPPASLCRLGFFQVMRTWDSCRRTPGSSSPPSVPWTRLRPLSGILRAFWEHTEIFLLSVFVGVGTRGLGPECVQLR